MHNGDQRPLAAATYHAAIMQQKPAVAAVSFGHFQTYDLGRGNPRVA